ncbi:MAG: RluA family pseudouridine synthase [Candidatus Omnitrophica bacterium]|nr:RluA family pseudouridine synthase [Candidatus Omnitrophota bacterium]
MSIHSLSVDEASRDVRVDVYVARALPDDIPSRMFVKKMIEAGQLTVNGRPVKAQYRVVPGDQVVVDIKPQDYPDARIKPEDVPLDILWEDDDLIAVNKPSGMSVHPAAGNYGGTLANALVHRLQGDLSDINGEKRPGIVHRLDKETSGIILVAKTNFAHARLAKQFEEHTLEKKYIALVEGEVQFDEGIVEAEIGQHRKYHDMRCIVEAGEGKAAETYYQVLKRVGRITSVALFPRTGRTHQLRLHMRHIGHPILGDEKYGNKGNFPRLALHAQAIFFQHPRNGKPLEFSVPVPAEFMPYL